MDHHEVFNDSYLRCNENPEFFTLFYQIFWESSDHFREMFADTDMNHQIQMLRASLHILMLASVSTDAKELVKRFGVRHGTTGYGVKPKDLDIWFECMLQTVSICDRNWTPEVELAWRQCFAKGIEVMKAHCSGYLPLVD